MSGRLYSPFLRLFRSTTGHSLTHEAGWVGDQMVGVGPEATPVFSRNAPIPLKKSAIDCGQSRVVILCLV
jgi:hypothetical protein